MNDLLVDPFAVANTEVYSSEGHLLVSLTINAVTLEQLKTSALKQVPNAKGGFIRIRADFAGFLNVETDNDGFANIALGGLE